MNHIVDNLMKKKRTWKSLLTIIILGLAVHVLLPQIAELKHSLNVIKNMSMWFVGLAIIMQILSYLGSSYMLQSLVKITGQYITVIKGLIITLASSSIGLIAGGIIGNAASTYRWLHTQGVNSEGAFFAGLLPSFFNNAILILISFVSVFHLLILHELSIIQIIGFSLTLAILLAIICIFVWGIYNRPEFTKLISLITHRWISFRKRQFNPTTFEENISKFFKAWDMLYKGGWYGPAFGSFLNILFDMMTLYFLFIAAGHIISIGVLITGYGLPLLLGKVSFLPGGVGIVESTMAILYIGLGVPNAVIIVIILTYRIFSFWIPTLVGFPLAFYLQRKGE